MGNNHPFERTLGFSDSPPSSILLLVLPLPPAPVEFRGVCRQLVHTRRLFGARETGFPREVAGCSLCTSLVTDVYRMHESFAFLHMQDIGLWRDGGYLCPAIVRGWRWALHSVGLARPSDRHGMTQRTLHTANRVALDPFHQPAQRHQDQPARRQTCPKSVQDHGHVPSMSPVDKP